MLLALEGWAQTAPPPGRVIAILADHDSRYKIAGQKQPEITVRAGEPITLRITAKKAKNLNRDGSIHGFSLLRAKDRKPVAEWDFLLKPGVQEFSLAAPHEAGEYVVVCTVICSQDHEGMNMRFVVLP
jgi:heme/copper-type cytochrome/quinol oxidase subunit 2